MCGLLEERQSWHTASYWPTRKIKPVQCIHVVWYTLDEDNQNQNISKIHTMILQITNTEKNSMVKLKSSLNPIFRRHKLCLWRYKSADTFMQHKTIVSFYLHISFLNAIMLYAITFQSIIFLIRLAISNTDSELSIWYVGLTR